MQHAVSQSRKNLFSLWILGAVLFLMTGISCGQQPGLPLPRPQLPDETASAPNHKATHHQPTKEVEEKLRKGFDRKNAAYAGSNIQPAVDDQSITLSGSVTSQMQHDMALQLAQAYADDRKIIDHLAIQP